MTNFSFPRSARLLSPPEFKRVMDKPAWRASERNFVFLAVPNGLPCARIGFVLPKRKVRLAVARNRVKRIIRESFRHCRAELAGIDIVVMARDGLACLDDAALRSAADRRFAFLASRRMLPPDPVNNPDTR